jgi:hypothetical protein
MPEERWADGDVDFDSMENGGGKWKLGVKKVNVSGNATPAPNSSTREVLRDKENVVPPLSQTTAVDR